MLKFKFDYLYQTLAYQTEAKDENVWAEIEASFEGNFGSLGFRLSEGWITFTVYENKIRAFYKQNQGAVKYFRKDLAKQAPVSFEFTEADEVEKVGKVWVKKGEHSM